jgi:LysR family hydrogen peroxide-inducible transcriptional activator
MLIQMVENGVGVTLLPAMATRGRHLDMSRLTVLPFGRPQPSRTVALAWRRSSPHRRSFEAFGEVLSAVSSSRW